MLPRCSTAVPFAASGTVKPSPVGLKAKNTELGTVINIAQGEFTVALTGDRIITFNPERFPHLDHGYAVTSYSSQGKTMDRVLVNAETTETDLLVNQRMAYVAVSRARLDARPHLQKRHQEPMPPIIPPETA